jgi:apolipoprotein N-acyltransferase
MPARLLLAYVAATFLAFPQPLGERFVLDLGLVLAPVAPALLAAGLRGLAPWRAARAGFLAGWLAHAALLHWFYVVTVHYGHAPALAGVLAPFGAAAYVALFPAAFALVAALLARCGFASPFALAAVWTACEWLRSFFLTGFPWGTLGYAWHQNTPALGIASLAGVYGLSFAASLLGFSALAWRWPLAGARAPRTALAGVATVVALHAAGALLGARTDAGAGTVRVAVLQGNVDQGVKWSPRHFEETLQRYEELTRRVAREGAQLIAWPETAVPAPLDYPELRERIAALAREVRTPLIVGAVGADFDASGRPLAYYDSAFVFSHEGELRERYDKAHLVPFGEYLPLRPLLGRFIRAVATGATASDVAAGAGPRALDIPLADGRTLRVGIPICYELIFPALVRGFAADGARLLVGITNDAWYGRTGSPHQFLAMTALRSAENGVPGMRAANTGVSAQIDARGRVLERTRIFEQDALVADVALASGTTFYARHGDCFALGCAVATVLLSLMAVQRGRKRNP